MNFCEKNIFFFKEFALSNLRKIAVKISWQRKMFSLTLVKMGYYPKILNSCIQEFLISI